MDTRNALLTVLDQVDYTAGACGPTEMVGAVLPVKVIQLAREAAQQEKPVGELIAAAYEVLEFEKPVVKNKRRKDAVDKLRTALKKIQVGELSKLSDIGN